MTGTRLLGYWREEHRTLDPRLTLSAEQISVYEQLRDRGRRWPDPMTLVDPTWDPDERAAVVAYLRIGTLVNQYRGLSPCRICGRHNGSAELSDGAFCWPEGLAHYVATHAVRLPEEFVEHALARGLEVQRLPAVDFDHLGQRDRSWPGAEFELLVWTPDPPRRDDAPDVDPDPSWWLRQAALLNEDHSGSDTSA